MKKRWERLIAAVMSVVMVQTVCPPQAMALAASEVKEAAEYLEIDQLFSATQSAVTTDSPENVETQTSAALFQDGAVRIYHALQLYAIGSNAVVHSGDAQAETFGTGTVLTGEDGQVLVYGQSQNYRLMNDIALPEGAAWALPSGFTGTFVSEGESTEAPLYDQDTDTVYLYNNYQLITLSAEDELKTVLSGGDLWPGPGGVRRGPAVGVYPGPQLCGGPELHRPDAGAEGGGDSQRYYTGGFQRPGWA